MTLLPQALAGFHGISDALQRIEGVHQEDAVVRNGIGIRVEGGEFIVERQHPTVRMGSKELKQFCELDEATKELLQFAMADLNLSARAYDRILKVARTIADLAGAENIASEHVSEAVQYRSLDRQMWG